MIIGIIQYLRFQELNFRNSLKDDIVGDKD